MKLNINSFALAAAISVTMFYIFGSFWFALAPERCFKQFAELIYLSNIEKYLIDFKFTPIDFTFNTIKIFISFFLVSWNIASIYNSLTKDS